jgi:hypothetical protein
VVGEVGLAGEGGLDAGQLLVGEAAVGGGGVAGELVVVEVLVPVDLVDPVLPLHLLGLFRVLGLGDGLGGLLLGGAGGLGATSSSSPVLQQRVPVSSVRMRSTAPCATVAGA